MQIMIGCERLKAMKCFQILSFPPFFFHPACLHTANCCCCNKTCFWAASSLCSSINFNHRDSSFEEAAFEKTKDSDFIS